MRKGKGRFDELLRWPKNVLSCISCTSAEVTAPELLAPQMLLERELRGALLWVQDGFTVKSASGAVFEDVDLSEKEWMDYDEKLGESIGIYDLEWKLQAVKL